MAGLDCPVPDYSTLYWRLARVPYRAPGQPLNLLIDIEESSTIGPTAMPNDSKFHGEGEWQVRKHGPQRCRAWRMVHIAMDAGAGDISAVEFTTSRRRQPAAAGVAGADPARRDDRHSSRRRWT